MRAFFLSLFITAMLPASVSAQGGFVPCEGGGCNVCQVVDMANELISWLIGISVLIAVMLMVVAGFRLMMSQGNQEAMQKAKSMAVNVVIGFILILSAWLIVDTILKLLTKKGGLDDWGIVECFVQKVPESSPDEIVAEDIAGKFIGEGGLPLSDADARKVLESAGIKAKEGVSYEGLRPHVISAAAALARDCDCDPLVTSATDGKAHKAGTYSHYEGYKLDLRTRDNPALVNYVQKLKPAGEWKDGTKTYYDAKTCGTYAIESDHIDVVYKPNCHAAL